MARTRPYILSIAGHDPSCGAGLAADLKTFEALRTYGLSVCTALTIQDEKKVWSVDWVSEEIIIRSLDVLFSFYQINWIKIGIIENKETLMAILNFIDKKSPKAKVIWDPVFRASDGHEFHKNGEWEYWQEVIEKCYLITPNWEEMKLLFVDQNPMKAASILAEKTHLFLKGGHHPTHPGKDFLYFGEKQFAFNPKQKAPYSKHGSGCILASAIAAHLARGFDLRRACLKGKTYTNRFLNSNRGMLGYHG